MRAQAIPSDDKRLAQWALEQSLKQGCQGAQVSVRTGAETEFSVRDRQVDKIQQAGSKALVLRLFADGRYGSFSTNRLERADVKAFLSRAVESVRCLAPDTHRRLPDPKLYYAGGGEELGLFDRKAGALRPEEKRQLAHAAADEVLGADARILSVQASYTDSESGLYLLASNGFEGERSSSECSLSVSVSVKGDGAARPESYWYERALTFDGLVKKDVGRKALDRTLRKLGQRKIESGRYPMLVDNTCSTRLLLPLLSALNGSALQQKNSFLLGKQGQAVLAEAFTLVDTPLAPRTFGARHFDDEGLATQTRAVFSKGVLEAAFIDTYYASKMGVAPTVGGPSHLRVEGGARTAEAIAAGLDRAVFVTGFNGGNCNSSSGDFSFGVEGFLVRGGKLETPVSEMNITGNMLALWKNLAEVGNDPRLCSAYDVPSLLFEGVAFSGL